MTDLDNSLDRLAALVGWHGSARAEIDWPALIADAGHLFPLDYRNMWSVFRRVRWVQLPCTTLRDGQELPTTRNMSRTITMS